MYLYEVNQRNNNYNKLFGSVNIHVNIVCIEQEYM